MALGVIRLEPSREPLEGALIDHVMGKTRPATAHVRAHIGIDVETIAPSAEKLEEARRAARELASQQTGGKTPHLGMSMIMGGGWPTDDLHADETTIPADAPATLAEGRPWTLDDGRRWFWCQRELVLEAVPEAKEELVSSLHLDEQKLHGHHELTAVAGGRVGAAVIKERFARIAPGFEEANARAYARLKARERAAAERDAAAKAAGKKLKRRRRWVDRGLDHCYVDHREQLRLIHDLYAERFADFGIVRGESGKRQYHERVDRAKGMEAKRQAIQREEERAAQRVHDLEGRADELRGECADLDRQKEAGFRRLDEIREAVAEEEAPDVARAALLVHATVRLQQRQSELQADLAERERAASAAVEREQQAKANADASQRLTRRAQTAIRRFFAAAETTLRRLRGEFDALMTRRGELIQSVEDLTEREKQAAETARSEEERMVESKRMTDTVIEADRKRAERSKQETDQTIETHQAATSKAKNLCAAAEAAAQSACASRNSIESEVAELGDRRQDLRDRLADDEALGYGRFGRRGRKLRRELEDERDAAVAERDAAVKGEGAMFALAREWEEFGRAQQERADAGDTRIAQLALDLHGTQIVRDVVDEGDAASELERAQRRRAAARAAAPGTVPAVQPSQRVPERPGPGIGG